MTRDLSDALAVSAGVPAVTEATARAYRFRAGKSMGWPLTRWVRHLQSRPAGPPAPGSGECSGGERVVVARPHPAERSTATLAIRAVGERAGHGLPAPWAAAVAAAARSRSADLGDALDRAVVGTDLGIDRKPFWWRAVNALQWLVTVAALAGVVWLLARVGFIALGLPTYDVLHVGRVPLATWCSPVVCSPESCWRCW